MSLTSRRRSLTMGLALASVSALAAPSIAMAITPHAPQTPAYDVTSPVEAKRVDTIDVTPKWESCGYNVNQECAYIDVPMDYDNPTGPKVKIGAQRNKTSKPGQKKGDLWFVDGSLSPTRGHVEFPENYLSADILDNFDIVGIQPRGTFKVEYTGAQCFESQKEQLTMMQRLNMSYPVVAADQEGYQRMAKMAAKGCSTRGLPLAAHLSIAQQVRDIEVMRRLFSKDKMTMATTFEGSQVAQTYANMFPDRVRAIYVNGAVDPAQYQGGVGQHALRPVRTGQDLAPKTVLERFFTWCDKKGVEGCAFAKGATEGTAKKFQGWYDTLLKRPVITPIPELPFDAGMLISTAMSYSHGADAPQELGTRLDEVWSDTTAAPKSANAQRRLGALAQKIGHQLTNKKSRQDIPSEGNEPQDPNAAPYNNFTDTWLIGLCSEGQQVSDSALFMDQITEVKRRSSVYGEQYAWPYAACASDIWKAVDQQQYSGDYTARIATPMLMGASRFSPLYTIASAQSANRRSPGSVLVTHEGWGTDAYMSSRCVAKVVDAYLIDGKLPSGNQSCAPEWKDELPVTK